MEKNKLGVVINTTKANNLISGFRSIYNYNSEEWSFIVRDTGAELNKVTNNSNSYPIHLIQFVSNGCCYCIMQPISGRKDYQSAWIFIHKDINLPKGELSFVIKKIEEFLSLDIVDKKAELDSLFAKTYPTSESPSYPPSSGDTYAVRYYGNETNLMYNKSHILEDYLYQSDYCNYKSVFLINKAKGQTVTDAEDISDKTLQKSVVIELPENIDGFKHNLGSNSIRVTEGTTLKIRWTRSGYAPIEKKGKTAEELKIQKSEYKKSFRLSLFRVIDKVTKKDLNVTPKFVGTYWVDDKQNPQIFFFKEEDLTRVSCHVDKANYHSFSDVIDLTKPDENGEFVIKLQPEEHIYNCNIVTNIQDCRRIEFVIKTQYKLSGNEIPGFKFDGSPSESGINILKAAPQQMSLQPPYVGSNHVTHRSMDFDEYDDKPKKNIKKKINNFFKYTLVALCFVVILGAISGGIYYLYKFIFPDEPKEIVESTYEQTIISTQSDHKSEKKESQTQYTWKDTWDYLNGNKEHWIRSEMDKYPDLKDVYVWIKDYEFKKLKSFIDNHPDLKEIAAWKNLYGVVCENNDKKGTFNAPSEKIDIKIYLSTDFKSMSDKNDVSSAHSENRSSRNASSNSNSTSNKNPKQSNNTQGDNN